MTIRAAAFEIDPGVLRPIESLHVPDVGVLAETMLRLSHFPNLEMHLPQVPKRARRDLASTLRRFAESVDPGPGAMELLGELSSLTDDWDGEGAPKPSTDAIERARAILGALEHGIDVDEVEVDADVLGGVALIVRSPQGKSVWIACMNNGKDTVVFSEGSTVSHALWNPSSVDSTLAFLGAAHGS